MRECQSGDAVGSESINFGEFCFVLMGFFYYLFLIFCAAPSPLIGF
jgi:hypothetical protein